MVSKWLKTYLKFGECGGYHPFYQPLILTSWNIPPGKPVGYVEAQIPGLVAMLATETSWIDRVCWSENIRLKQLGISEPLFFRGDATPQTKCY